MLSATSCVLPACPAWDARRLRCVQHYSGSSRDTSCRGYRNPEFFAKMVEHLEIQQYGTSFAPEVRLARRLACRLPERPASGCTGLRM